MPDYLAEAIKRRKQITSGTPVADQKRQNVANKAVAYGIPVPQVGKTDLQLLGDRGRTGSEILSDLGKGVQIFGNRKVQDMNAVGAVASGDQGEFFDELAKTQPTYATPTPPKDFQYGTQDPNAIPTEPEPYEQSDIAKSLNAWFHSNIAGDQEDITALQEEYSDPTKLAKQRIEEAAKQRKATSKTLLPMGQAKEVMDYVEDFTSAVGDYVDNPLAALAGATESSGDILAMMVGGGVISKLAAKGITKEAIGNMSTSMLKKTLAGVGADLSSSQLSVLAKGLTKKATKEVVEGAAKKGATRATAFGSAYTGLAEGGSNAIQAYDQVMAMSPEDLVEKSPEFNKLLDNNDLSIEEAQKIIADRVMRDTGLAAGLFAVGVGKVTGATEAVSTAAIKGGLAQGIKKTGTAALREGVEETIQSGGGQAISNIIAKRRSDITQDIMEGVTDQAAAGLASGSLMGGAIPATGTIVKEVLTPTAKMSIKQTGKALSTGKQELGKVIQKINISKTDPELRETIAVLNTKLDSAEINSVSEAPDMDVLYDDQDAISTMAESLKTKASANNTEIIELEADIAEGNVDKAELKEVKTELKQRKKENDVIQTELDNIFVRAEALTEKAIELTENPKQIIEGLNSDNPTRVQQAAAKFDQMLALDPTSISLEEANAILAADTGNQLSEVTRLILTNSAEDRLNNTKDTILAVAKDKVEGSVGFTGLRQYRDGLYKALLSDNPAMVTQIMGTLGRWVETDDARTSTILSALAGNEVAMQSAKTRYSKVKLSPVVGKVMQDENTLMHDVYNNLFNIVTQSSPELADSLKYKESTGSIVEVPKPAPKAATPSKGVITEGRTTSATEAAMERIKALPKGYNKIGAITVSNKNWKINTASGVRTLSKTNVDLVDQFTTTKWTEQNLTELEGMGVTETEIKKAWNIIADPKSTNEQYAESVTYLNDAKKAIKELSAVTIVTEDKKPEPVVVKEEVTPEPEGNLTTDLVDKPEVTPSKVTSKLNTRTDVLKSSNIITNYFTAKSPLNEVRQAFSKLAEDNYKFIQDNLPEGFFDSSTVEGDTTSTWDEAQTKAVDSFIKFKDYFTEFKPAIEKALKAKQEFSYKNYAADLLNTEDQLDDNIYDALALSVFKWVNTEANGTLFTNEKSIKRKLGLDQKNFLPQEARVLYTAGVNQDEIITSLGSQVYSMLGFTAKKNIDRSAKAKLINSLGQIAMKMAMDTKMIYENTAVDISNKQYESWKGNEVEETYKLKFFKVANQILIEGELPKINTELQAYVDTEQESGRVMLSFLDTDNFNKQPYFSKEGVSKNTPTKMKGTNQTITGKLKAIIEKHMQRPSQVKPLHTIHSTMTRTQKATLLGYVQQDQLDAMPFYKKETVIAQNEDIVRSIKTYEDFIKGMENRSFGLKSNIYFAHEVWRNLRMGMVSSTVNPQASKYDRHLIGQVSDKSTFNIDSMNTKHINFLLAVALGMGVSTDKKQVQTSLDELKNTVNNPLVQKGITAVQELQKDTSQAETLNNDIIAAVDVLGEKMHSYEALVAYAEYLTSKDKGDKQFVTTLTAETDGVTNGPALGTFLMGGAKLSKGKLKILLEAAGFKFDNMELSHGVWKEQNQDLYEQTASKITYAMESATLPLDVKRALAFFMGAYKVDKESSEWGFVNTPRNFPKETVTGASYGQGEMSVKKYAGRYGLNETQNMLFAKGEKGWNQNKKGIGSILAFVDHTNKGKAIAQLNKLTYQDFFDKGLPKELTEVLFEGFQTTYGVMLNDAISANFAGLQATSKIVGGLSNVMYTLYKTKLDAAIQTKKEELESTSPSEFNSKIDDLPDDVYKQVVASVKEYLPVFDNVFSKESGNLIDNGIRIGKSRKAKVVDENGNAKSSHVVEGLMGKVNISETVEDNPGISAVAAMVHSIDASIMYRTIDDNAVTNIFDAILAGVNSISKGSRKLNQSTYEILTELNPLQNVYNRFKTISGEMTQDMVNNLSEDDFEALSTSIAGAIAVTDTVEVKSLKEFKQTIKNDLKTDSAKVMDMLDTGSKAIADKTVETKNALLADLTYVTQYNKEDDGAIITDGKVSFNPEYNKETLNTDVNNLIEDLGKIETWIEPTPEPVSVIPDTVAQEVASFEALTKEILKVNPLLATKLDSIKEAIKTGEEADLSVLGNQMEAYIKSGLRTLNSDGFATAKYKDPIQSTAAEKRNEKVLLDASDNGIISGKTKIVEALKKLSKQQGAKQSITHKFLLKFIAPLLAEDLTLAIVTDENYAQILGNQDPTLITTMSVSAGLFDPKTNRVYLRSTDDIFNGVSIETITHELIHATVALVDGRRGNVQSNELTLLRKQLDTLLDLARKYDKTNQFINKGLFDRGELIAYGLTNIEFQSWLKKQQVTTKVSLFAKFTDVLRTFFKVPTKEHSLFTELLTTSEHYFEQVPLAINTSTQTGSLQQSVSNPIALDIKVDSLNALEVFDVMAGKNHTNISNEHTNHLRDTLSSMFTSAILPIKMLTETNSKANMGETLANRIRVSSFDTSASVPSSGMVNKGFNASTQEVYTNELLNVILSAVTGDSSPMGQRVNNLFKLAKKSIVPEDLRVLGSESDQDLQTKWNSVFEPRENVVGRVHHLREFLAMAKTNEVLRNALKDINVPKYFAKTAGDTFLHKVKNLVGEFLDMVFSKYAHIPQGGNALTQLETIAKNIALQEDKGKSLVFRVLEVPLNTSTQVVDKALRLTREGLRLVSGDAPKNIVTKAAKILGDTYDYRGENVATAAKIIGNKIIGKGRLKFNGMLLNEAMGEVDSPSSTTNSFNNTKVHELLRKFKTVIDKVGQENKASMINELRNAFGKLLTNIQLSALCNVVLRADMRALVQHGINTADIINMLLHTGILQTEINNVRRELRKLVKNQETFDYYMAASKAMGIKMIKDIDTEPLTLSNPQRIQDMDGVKEYKTVHPVQGKEVLELIDTLGSMYAMQALEPKEAKIAAEVMLQQEHSPTSGINFMLSMATAIQEDAKENQFGDSPKNFVKGYVPDATNNTKALATSDSAKDIELLRQGYVHIKRLKNDPKDTSSEVRHLYINNSSGVLSYIQGAMYINETSAQGHSLYGDRMKSQSGFVAMEATQEFKDIIAAKRNDILSMLKPKSNAKKGMNYMRPSFNGDGNISDFRYVTSGSLKDTFLDRNNDAFLAMGNLANMNHVVPKTKDANKTLIDTLKEQYETDKANGNLSRYISVSPTTIDKRVKNAYHMLPKDTQKYIKEVFGKPSLPIRNDLFDVVIGQRKWGISELWREDEKDLSKFEYLTVKTINTLTAQTGKYWLPKVERGIMEAVSKVKDIVINLSGTVLMANTTSNTNYLVSRGLSTREAIRLQAEALNEVKQYNEHNQRRLALNYRIQGNYNPSEHDRYRSELKELNALIANNKVTPLIEAGLLPTIAEEQDTTEDTTNSYGTKLSNWIDKTAGRDSNIRNTLHNVAFTKDTEMYKMISSLTQLSDFSSKYALINYLTTRKNNRLNSQQAFAEATRAFVNYDLPTHKALQYLGDIGILWFPRYAVRIQRTILDSIADNPSRVLGLLMINLMTGSMVPSIYQSLMGVAYNPANLVGFLDRFASGAMLHPVLRPF